MVGFNALVSPCPSQALGPWPSPCPLGLRYCLLPVSSKIKPYVPLWWYRDLLPPLLVPMQTTSYNCNKRISPVFTIAQMMYLNLGYNTVIYFNPNSSSSPDSYKSTVSNLPDLR